MTGRAARSAVVVLLLAAAGSAARGAEGGGLTMDQAVAIALQRNRDVVAARLEIAASELDVVAARLYPNPQFQYNLGNLVLGSPNPQNQGGPPPPPPPVQSGFFGQPVQSVGVSEVVDIWAKRSAHIRAADRGVEHQRLVVEDALREIVFAVRSAFADVLREQSERQLAHDFAARYGETIHVSQARFKAGDISEAELRKIELEGLRYQNDVIDADMQLDVARGKLAALLALPSARELPGGRLVESESERPKFASGELGLCSGEPIAGGSEPVRGFRCRFDEGTLTSRALERRPDLRAAGAARTLAETQIAAARRDAYPDISLGVGYTHSSFQVSGDNPNTLGLSLSFPLPIFDRNQANIGRARLDLRRADNDNERLRIEVARQVAEAVRKAARAATLLAVFERPAGGDVPGSVTGTSDRGGMIERAETALRVAEKSYRGGALSLLELLDAQRTYLETRAQYLRALYDFREAAVEVSHAVGEP